MPVPHYQCSAYQQTSAHLTAYTACCNRGSSSSKPLDSFVMLLLLLLPRIAFLHRLKAFQRLH